MSHQRVVRVLDAAGLRAPFPEAFCRDDSCVPVSRALRWAEGLIDEVRIRGCRLKETVLAVRPAGTLLVADLVHNVGRPEGAWTRFYTRAMGFYDRVALSRALRWTAFSDRAAARQSIDEVLALPFERIIVGTEAPSSRTQGGRSAPPTTGCPRGGASFRRDKRLKTLRSEEGLAPRSGTGY